MKFLNQVKKYGPVIAVASLPLASNAAIDTTAATTALGEAATAIGVVFAALLAVKGAMIGIPWVLGVMGKR